MLQENATDKREVGCDYAEPRSQEVRKARPRGAVLYFNTQEAEEELLSFRPCLKKGGGQRLERWQFKSMYLQRVRVHPRTHIRWFTITYNRRHPTLLASKGI